MFIETKRNILALIFLVAFSNVAWSKTYVWISTEKTIQQFQLPPVLVTGTRINWGSGFFSSEISYNDSVGGGFHGNLGEGIASARERALDLANACKNPFISPDAQAVVGGSSTDARWLAAQEMFNTIQARRMWTFYGQATGGVSIIVGGISYNGFQVTYADGARETWLVNPGWATSTIKLFDSPAPNSLNPGAPGSGCKGNG